MFAKNKKRVSAFYQETLGLDVEAPQPRTICFGASFVVSDLEAVLVAAAKTGGYLKPLESAWHFQACIVLDGWDPEGNVVQLKLPE